MILWRLLVGIWLLVCFFALSGLLIAVLVIGLVITGVAAIVSILNRKGNQ